MNADVEQYVGRFDGVAGERLSQLRALIKELLPDAEEKMGYGVLGYYKKSPIVYLAAFKNHIGMYPVPQGDEAFRAELSQYQTGKGTVRFLHEKLLPIEFIKHFVRLLAKESEERNLSKSKKE